MEQDERQDRALIPQSFLRLLANNGICPVCRDDRGTLIYDDGDYHARLYCLRCDFDLDLLLFDEYRIRYPESFRQKWDRI